MSKKVLLKIFGLVLFALYFAGKCNAEQQITDFNYTIVNNTCVIYNPLNTKVLSDAQGSFSLVTEHQCSDVLNDSIAKLRNLSDELASQKFSCILDLQSVQDIYKNDTDTLTDVLITLNEQTELCFGCYDELKSAQLQAEKCNLTENVWQEKVYLAEQRTKSAERDYDVLMLLFAITFAGLSFVIIMLMNGGKMFNKIRGLHT